MNKICNNYSAINILFNNSTQGFPTWFPGIVTNSISLASLKITVIFEVGYKWIYVAVNTTADGLYILLHNIKIKSK